MVSNENVSCLSVYLVIPPPRNHGSVTARWQQSVQSSNHCVHGQTDVLTMMMMMMKARSIGTNIKVSLRVQSGLHYENCSFLQMVRPLKPFKFDRNRHVNDETAKVGNLTPPVRRESHFGVQIRPDLVPN